MENKNDNDLDFYDREYNKMQNSNGGNGGGVTKSKKPLAITLIVSIVLLSVMLGVFLCSLYGCIVLPPTNTSNTSESVRLLSDMIDYFKTYYYNDNITEEQWTEAVEKAGTAILETVGDKYCSLMSPQTYYDYMNPESTSVGTDSGKLFGFQYSLISSVGLYVSSVVTDSAAYGNLQAEDLVLKLTDAKDANGNALTVDGKDYSTILLADYATTNDAAQVLSHVNSATFHVLRGGEIFTVPITRAAIDFVNSEYPFEYVEFFFGKDCTNVSTEVTATRGYTTYQDRCLDKLPSDTGYIRIVQFMYSGSSDVLDEFTKAMQLFKQRGLKRLVLDVKGNPGGRVDYVCQIAAMLLDDFNLTSEQKALVTSGNKLLITKMVPKDASQIESEYHAPTYKNFFAVPTDGKCNIVIWTDGNSASASELLTGALTDYGTAVQMGTKTYGKGIAQTIVPLTGHRGTVVKRNGELSTASWAIYFTFARYYSPLGTNIHGTGYTPTGEFNNLKTYSQLWQATLNYWNK